MKLEAGEEEDLSHITEPDGENDADIEIDFEGGMEDYYMATDLYDSTVDTAMNPLIDNPDESNWGYILRHNSKFGSLRNNLDFLAKDALPLPRLFNRRAGVDMEEHLNIEKELSDYSLA